MNKMKNSDEQNNEAKQYPNAVERVLDRIRNGEGLGGWSVKNPIPASTAERRAQERARILSARLPLRFEDECSDLHGEYEARCPVCGAACCKRSDENLRRGWYGLGVDEHCIECGAESVDHDLYYRGRLENFSLESLIDELYKVELMYCSSEFMSRGQIADNRRYFSNLLEAIQRTTLNHIPDRHRKGIDARHAQELYQELINLAAQLYGGDRYRAEEEYMHISRDINDLYTIIDELKLDLEHVGSASCR